MPPDWLLFGAGLEQLIDQISRALLEPGARVLLPVPNFDPFETFSRRMGAEVDPLHPPGLRWDRAVTREAAERLRHGRFRLLWLSNPVNPTGQHIPVAEIGRMVKAARLAGTAVVVDEAYGEYTDRPEGVVSASRFLAEAPNLLVLRTFSKAHCLPGGRVGYLLCASGGLRKAVDAYRPMFPAPWISLHLAKLAASDPDHATRAREMAAGRRTRFLANASRLPGFQFLASDTNTIMFRHHQADADTLHAALAARGFLTANLNSLTGIQGHNWLRLTLHRDELNDAFLQACRKAVQYLG
ncbi:pyridoxal phosphate-dependent aminotransferase [Desulfohalovibrio reitneri]|uniref:pyridoxal phosphate-dependent aminotransferase n=1 Tax=Desulfohalovibrio reitneri TaxID=1307759 RepID=UPI0004A6FC4D|nr:histidinol-phosphate transaminase [Desulfohalovibrio reitneri]